MNPSVSRSRIDHNCRFFGSTPFVSRLAPRCGVRHGEGKRDGSRCVPTFQISPTNQPPNPRPELWRNSKFDTPEDLEVFSRMFDEGVKRTFSSDHTSQFVKFCRPRDNDPLCGIRAGKLRLTG